MTSKETGDDRAARKERADAIRRARDTRNARLTTTDSERPCIEDSGDADQNESLPDDANREPNYVDFIDRKMREKKKLSR
jgi:hypothetical protein